MATFSQILISSSSKSLFKSLFNFNNNENCDIKLELLSQITCDGDENLNVKSFKITCDTRVANNRKDFVANHSTISVFSHLLVNYGIDPETKKDLADEVVKVMAIVHLGKRFIENNKQRLGRVFLIVAGMTRSAPSPGSSLPYETLSYTFDKNDLYFGLIDLNTIRQPVCVVPEYSNVQVAGYEETFADRAVYISAKPHLKIKASPPRAALFRFLLVPNYNPVYDNAKVKVVSEVVYADYATSSSGLISVNRVGDVNSLVLDNEALNVLNRDIMDIAKLSIQTDLDSEIHSVASDDPDRYSTDDDNHLDD